MPRLVSGELVSGTRRRQQLTQRVKELAERYDTPLPQMVRRAVELEAKVNRQLERMGVRMDVKPDFKQTQVGVIPNDWAVVLLDSVARRGSGHTPDKAHPEYWGGTIKWISLRARFEIGCQACNSSSSALASFKSKISKASVDKP
jgi:hypothetical protein